jgi:biopolymer transport protein ExbD
MKKRPIRIIDNSLIRIGYKDFDLSKIPPSIAKVIMTAKGKSVRKRKPKFKKSEIDKRFKILFTNLINKKTKILAKKTEALEKDNKKPSKTPKQGKTSSRAPRALKTAALQKNTDQQQLLLQTILSLKKEMDDLKRPNAKTEKGEKFVTDEKLKKYVDENILNKKQLAIEGEKNDKSGKKAEKKRDVDSDSARKQLDELEGLLKKATLELEQINKEKYAAQDSASEIGKNLVDDRKEKKKLENDVVDLAEKIKLENINQKELERKTNEYKLGLERVELEMKKKSKELEEKNNEFTRLEKTYKKILDSKTSTEKELGDARKNLEKKITEIEEKETEFKKLDSLYDNLKEKYVQTTEGNDKLIKDLRQDKMTLNETLNEWNKKYIVTEKELRETQKKYTEQTEILNDEIDNLKTINLGLDKKLKETENTILTYNEEKKNLEDEIQEIKKKIPTETLIKTNTDLSNKIKEAKQKGLAPDADDFKPKFIIRADGKSVYKKAEKVIDVFRELNLNNLNFVTSSEFNPNNPN